MNILKLGMVCAVAIGITACGGGSGSTGGVGTPTSSPTTSLFVHVKDIQGQYLAGTDIYYGGDGKHAVTTNSGAIRFGSFLGVPEGSYEVHAEVADGFKVSMYGAETSTTTPSTSIDIGWPYYNGLAGKVSIGVPVTGGNGTTVVARLVTDKGAFQASVVGGIAHIPLYDYKPGSTVTGTLLIAQGVANTTAVANTAAGFAEVVDLGQQTFTAGTLGALVTIPQYSFPVTLAAAPVAPLLTTVNSVTPPVGMDVVYTEFGGASLAAAGFAIPLPDDLYAANMKRPFYIVEGHDKVNKTTWTKRAAWAAIDTVMNVTSKFTAPPQATSQSGNTITWSSATSSSPIDITTVEIIDNTNWVVWRAAFKGDINTWTLPTAPTLPAGNYTLRILSILAPTLTIEEFVADNYPPNTPLEYTTAYGIPYTP